MGKVGRYGMFGGQYVPETVMNAVHELETAYEEAKADPTFWEEYRTLCRDYANRPSLLYYAERMTKDLGGCKIYLKREDLNHTGAHKINNVLGQILLAKRMGKKRIIAETGAGQHGVATATACALFDLECEVFMGKEDVERQKLNARRAYISLTYLGESAPVHGSRALLDELCQNLCDNAIRYNRPGGKVQLITACSRDGHCTLTVTDNGIGIPRDAQSSVFERFYRVDKSRSKATGGTGLGLAIVKHIARIHNARIKLESQVDVGTTITVTFPTAN